ncbi:succinate dehydrogenase [Alteribacter lacisalsi]|jgi:succinate dehydrogenase / fumarate reductase, cytochrome b subunit|uniref:Succinate dehydrogenase n=1 Tax=Alteribacter lacisalsi TaxID=2045244 RepID=A0A2W0H608_9BACI|nr:succinate dehydrogenase cytochrome b558 subunit [Alteribacter lacisalsi]PYZ97294.1 succinate dehydrogenase [Alteribacter lacisalsi]
MAQNREYFLRKMHSLLGVIPVGLFIIVHFGVNYFSVRGEEEYNQAVAFMENLPFRYAMEIFIIFLPILFHAIYGIYIAFQARHNTSSYGYFRNWMFRLQRVTGIIVLIFMAWHVWETRIAAAMGQEVNFDMMANIVENPVALVAYLIGILATTFHFANGLWSFGITWGITVSPRSQQISTYITLGFFLVLSYVGVASILAFL